jgi:hypothetical protein
MVSIPSLFYRGMCSAGIQVVVRMEKNYLQHGDKLFFLRLLWMTRGGGEHGTATVFLRQQLGKDMNEKKMVKSLIK